MNDNIFKKYNNIVELFNDQEFMDYLQAEWPASCQNINNLNRQNNRLSQEVGKNRERGILYLFDKWLGENKNYNPINYTSIAVNEKDIDCTLFDKEVSIKTRTDNGAIKISWIDNDVMAEAVMANWLPKYDILLCDVVWNSDKGGFYYFSQNAIKNVLDSFIENNKIALSKGKGNSKGTKLTSAFIKALKAHADTLYIKISLPEEIKDDDFFNRVIMETKYEYYDVI